MAYTDKEKRREYGRQYYSRRRQEDPNYNKNEHYNWKEKRPKKYILSRARSRATRDGIPFTITEDDFDIPEYCPIFRHLKLEFSSGRDSRPGNIPSLDRINPSLGYVPGNVAVISLRANRIKNNATAQELLAIAEWINAQQID